MHEEIANLVFPILAEGIRLKESLASDEPPEFQQEQKNLHGMIQATAQAQHWARVVGTGPDSSSGRSDQFLGIKYALVCWLDEIFIADDSSWKEQWTENSLEQAFYGSRDRAWKFWEQWKRASSQAGTDSMETYYMCVILGFRGDLLGLTDELEKRLEAAKAQLDKDLRREFPGPVAAQPRTYLPELKGIHRLQRLMLAAGAAVLLALPAAVIYFITR